MRRGPLLTTSLLALLLHMPALSQAQQQEPIDPTPPPLGTASFIPPPAKVEDEPLTAATYVVRAAVTNMSEIELGELALGRSQDEQIRSFAKRMIADHQKAQAELRPAAAEAKVALPGTVDIRHKQLKQALAGMEGKEFDLQYARTMAQAHDFAVALHDAAAHSKELPEVLRRYATRVLPIVRAHRDDAHALHSKQAEAASR